MHRSLLLVALLVSPVAVSAQEDDDKRNPTSRQEIRERAKKAANLEPYEISDSETRLLGWEKKKFPQNWLVKGWRGFRPMFGGMPSGSGTVIGGGYIHGLEAQYFEFQANARWSTKGYTTADAEVVLLPPQIGRRVELKVRGGAYGEGERMKLGYTRNLVRAALSGALAEVETVEHPIFGVHVPRFCPDVPSERARSALYMGEPRGLRQAGPKARKHVRRELRAVPCRCVGGSPRGGSYDGVIGIRDLFAHPLVIVPSCKESVE